MSTTFVNSSSETAVNLTTAARSLSLPIGSIAVPFGDYLICRILNMNSEKELLWSLWVRAILWQLCGLWLVVKIQFRESLRQGTAQQRARSSAWQPQQFLRRVRVPDRPRDSADLAGPGPVKTTDQTKP